MCELQVPDTADDDAEGFHSVTYHPGTLLASPASPTFMHHCSPLTRRRCCSHLELSCSPSCASQMGSVLAVRFGNVVRRQGPPLNQRIGFDAYSCAANIYVIIYKIIMYPVIILCRIFLYLIFQSRLAMP